MSTNLFTYLPMYLPTYVLLISTYWPISIYLCLPSYIYHFIYLSNILLYMSTYLCLLSYLFETTFIFQCTYLTVHISIYIPMASYLHLTNYSYQPINAYLPMITNLCLPTSYAFCLPMPTYLKQYAYLPISYQNTYLSISTYPWLPTYRLSYNSQPSYTYQPTTR